MSATAAARTAVPLVVDGLSVRYGALSAVERLSFTVRPGEIYGLIGSNGAGKSSTIRCIVGLQRPSDGQLRVFGHDPRVAPRTAKELIGYVPESTLLFDALTPHEFLEFVAGVRRLPASVASARALSFAQALDLHREFDRPLATLSQGTRQKVLVLAALLHQPPFLVLDEPLNNLDPKTVRILKELFRTYVRTGGRGILFSTHTMEIAEQLCDRIGILERGRLIGEGTLAELRERLAHGDASLEEVYLRLTAAEDRVRAAVRTLSEG
jgi:ABC-2 type transport system ATP-binding protein